jgi:hypothetical protein
MDESTALTIVSTLANGVNPLTGEVFPPDSPYQTPDVVRALFLAARVLEGNSKPKSRGPSLPGNAGKPWTAEEDQRLLHEFDRGASVTALAQAHSRTNAGIQARLEKHGRLQASTGPQGETRRWRSPTNGGAPAR